MIFQHTIDKVLSGEKTQTRCIVKVGEQSFVDDMDDEVIACVTSNTGRVKWEVNKTYGVQAGRGKPAVARIQITGIRREDVREISDADVEAEGFQSTSDFWHTWVSMHDKSWYDTFCYAIDCDYLHEYGFYKRPEKRYQAWVLTFKAVQE